MYEIMHSRVDVSAPACNPSCSGTVRTHLRFKRQPLEIGITNILYPKYIGQRFKCYIFLLVKTHLLLS